MSKPITLSNPARRLTATAPTTPPAGPERIASLPRNRPRVGEAAVRLHEAQAHVAELRRHAVHVAAQDGGEVGVDHGGLAAADELHERAGLVRDGDLGEAGGARQLRHAPLVLRVGVAVHEGDGDGVEAGAAGLLQPAPRAVLVERAHDRRRPRRRARPPRARARRPAPAAGCRARRCPAGPGSRCAARRRSRAWSRRASATPRARGARWSPPSCPCGPRRRRSAGIGSSALQPEQIAHALRRRRPRTAPGPPRAACACAGRRPAAAPPRR